MTEHIWLGGIGFQFQKAGISIGWFLITGWPLRAALSWTAGRPPGTHFSSDHALEAGLLAGRRHPCWATGLSTCSILGTGEPHGQRSLVGYSPWGHKESDTTERLHSLTHRGLQSCHILIPACASSSPVFLMMYSVYKL